MKARKWCVRWDWQVWLFGVMFPHGGMIVYVLRLGPLSIEFWPLAQDIELF